MTEIRKITLQFPSLRAFLTEYGERISTDGMLLRGEMPPAAGSTVDIEVVVAEGMRLLRVRGETLWSGAIGGSHQKAAAVRFDDLDEPSRTLIGKIVDQRRRDGAELFRLDDVPGPREARLRDLTVPAAAVFEDAPEPVSGTPESIFDLAEPPAAATDDLFASAPASAEPGPTAPESPEPPPPPQAAPPVPASPGSSAVAEEAPARARTPRPPVPLLADPEPALFDLGPDVAAGDEGEVGASPDSEPEMLAESEAVPHPDLSDLFGGDEPQMAPARGRTEAFPPSFVDEVEAELEAADIPEPAASSFSVVDTGELEVRLGATAEQPEPDSASSLDPIVAPPMPPPVVEEEPSLELEIPVEPETQLEPEAQPEPEIDLGTQIELEPTTAADPRIDLDEVVESGPPVEVVAPPEAVPEQAPEPEPETPVKAESEPEPRTEAEPEAAPEPPAAAASDPVAGSEFEPGEASKLVAEAFNAERGPETVEIPLMKSSPAGGQEAPPPAGSPPVVGHSVEPPPVASPPPAAAPAPPPVEESAKEPVERPVESPVERPATMPDDNLLSIPEFSSESAPAVEPVAAAPGEMPSSAQSLRGAASRSHHVGTWLLIALLVGALGIAGYFLMGMLRGGDQAEPDAATTAPPPASTPAEASADQAPAEDVPADEVPAPEETSPSASETSSPEAVEAPTPSPPVSAGQTAPAEAESPAATGPLAGLDRITWSETDAETILVMVGDGAMPHQQIGVVPIGGDQPRLVIKIPGVARPFQPAVLEVGTSHVLRVRTGLQSGGGLHVVVDLAAAGISVRHLASQGSRLEVRLAVE